VQIPYDSRVHGLSGQRLPTYNKRKQLWFFLRTCFIKCIFQAGFANDATLCRAIHKWDSAAAPLLRCVDNIRFHGCGSSYRFLSSFGAEEEREDRRRQYFICYARWQTSQKHQRDGINPTLKQKCWSAERKHSNAQRTSGGEGGEAVRV